MHSFARHEETRGHRLLKRWMAEAPRERTYQAIAADCGCSRVAVYHWLTRFSRPRGEFRQILSVIAGIPQRAWLYPDEREALRAAERGGRALGRTRAA